MRKILGIFLPIMMSVIMAFSYTTTVFAEGDNAEYLGEPLPTDVVATDEDGWPIAPDPISGSIMMVETNTNAVLFSKDEDTQRYPASTTKILTALVALENCSLNEKVTFSANACDLEEGATSIDAVEGEELSMKDCLYGLMLPSGNDCAIAIAEHIAGSEEAFAEMMNERAASIGCENSNFVNPHGLYSAKHYTTASDLCKIAQVAFNNSAFVEIVSHAKYTIPASNKSEARVIENTNYMIDPSSSYYNENVIGGKTGYLYESGRCLVTLAKKDDLSVITVAMFCPNYMGVFNDTEELLDYVFNGFSLKNIAEAESRFTFATNEAHIKLDSTTQILMPKTLEIDDLESKIDFTYDMDLDEFNQASANAGITTRDGRHLYAIINYSYAGHYLGHLNVILDDNMEIASASFASIRYISIWWFVLFIAAMAAIVVMTSLLIKKVPEMRRKKKTRVIRTQTDDGHPIPVEFIKAQKGTRMTQTVPSRGGTTRVRQIEDHSERRRPARSGRNSSGRNSSSKRPQR